MFDASDDVLGSPMRRLRLCGLPADFDLRRLERTVAGIDFAEAADVWESRRLT
jgi:hypothetical protein